MQEIKREIYSGQELDRLLKKGVDKLSNAVKVTMGPKGKLVLIQRPGRHPLVTKDGVTVAQAINLKNEVENLGAQIIKESASRTAEEAGDGTTTATVLSQFIYNEGLKLKMAGFDILQLKEGIIEGKNVIIDCISNDSKPVSSKEDLLKVATISANGEEEVAKLIVDAIEAAGVDGHIIVEEAKGFKSSLTIVEGFQMERGFLSPYFVSDKNRMVCEFEKPLIFMADKSINSLNDVAGPLEYALENGRSILLITNNTSDEAMQSFVVNKLKGNLSICAINSPGFGGTKHDLLLDLQSVIGGKVIDASFDMANFEPEMFGTCKKVIVHKNKTLIVNGSKTSNETIQRIQTIKERLAYPGLDDKEIELLSYRIRQLSGGIAILRVGAATESELIERYDRVDDALHATKAAIEEGVIPGGGIALYRMGILPWVQEADSDKSYVAGINILREACKEPFKQILENAGIQHQTVLNKINSQPDCNELSTGYDVRNKVFGDMFELGVLDPAKVARCALENAVSAATMLLLADCSLIEVENDKNDISRDNY